MNTLLTDQDFEDEQPKKIISGTEMSRKDIVRAVTEPDSVILLGEAKKKSIVIDPGRTEPGADVNNVVDDLTKGESPLIQQAVKLFVEKKRPTAVNTKVFVMRIKNLDDKQLKVVHVLCLKNEFTSINIIKAVQSIRRFNGVLLLALRSFVDLKNLTPFYLTQFFTTVLPQTNPEEVGREAHSKEIEEKNVTSGQVYAFYNICHQIEDIEPSNAVNIFRLSRKLKFQHLKIINAFLKRGVTFGGIPITNKEVLNLIKLWLITPELVDKKRFKGFIKKVTKRKEIRQDFKLISQAYKTEIVEERAGKGLILSLIRKIFKFRFFQ